MPHNRYLITEEVNKKANETIDKFNRIIENELKAAQEEYNVSRDKLILQSHPDGSYAIAIVVSKFSIEHEFIIKSQSLIG